MAFRNWPSDLTTLANQAIFTSIYFTIFKQEFNTFLS